MNAPGKPALATMSIYTSHTSTGDAPITQITFYVSPDGKGFQERPMCESGDLKTLTPSSDPLARPVRCEKGFRGYETFHDPNTLNITKIALYPNCVQGTSVTVTASPTPDETLPSTRMAKMIMPVGTFAN